MSVTVAELQTALSDLFAPWIQELGLRVHNVPADDTVVLWLPHSDRLARMGGTLCGQAMMAACDTAMVLALMRHFGQFRPCTTVQMSTSFLKPLSEQDALVTVRLSRVGKGTAFGEAELSGAADVLAAI